jgi:hypothetical protein
MKFLTALLEQIFGQEQAGGETMCVTFTMDSPTHCSFVRRYSTCGGDETEVKFEPPLPLDIALVYAQRYTEKGRFIHK